MQQSRGIENNSQNLQNATSHVYLHGIPFCTLVCLRVVYRVRRTHVSYHVRRSLIFQKSESVDKNADGEGNLDKSRVYFDQFVPFHR